MSCENLNIHHVSNYRSNINILLIILFITLTDNIEISHDEKFKHKRMIMPKLNTTAL